MRYREVKKGMKVKVYRIQDCLNGKYYSPGGSASGIVTRIAPPTALFTVYVDMQGVKGLFSHKELKEVK